MPTHRIFFKFSPLNLNTILIDRQFYLTSVHIVRQYPSFTSGRRQQRSQFKGCPTESIPVPTKVSLLVWTKLLQGHSHNVGKVISHGRFPLFIYFKILSSGHNL